MLFLTFSCATKVPDDNSLINTPPKSVTDFKVTAGYNEVRLTWKNPSEFDSIGIMRSLSVNPKSITQGTKIYQGRSAIFIDKVSGGNRYYYSIFVKKDQRVSYSQWGNAFPYDLLMVRDFQAERYKENINISWVNPVDSSFVGVEIRRSEGTYPKSVTDGEHVCNVTSSVSNCMDVGVDKEKVYFYSAFSYNGTEYSKTFARTRVETWSKIYKMPQFFRAEKVFYVDDYLYISGKECFLAKINVITGGIEWIKNYEVYDSSNIFMSFERDSKNNLYILFNGKNIGDEKSSSTIIKINSNDGNIIWQIEKEGY